MIQAKVMLAAVNEPVFMASWCSSVRADTDVSITVLDAVGALYWVPLAQLTPKARLPHMAVAICLSLGCCGCFLSQRVVNARLPSVSAIS